MQIRLQSLPVALTSTDPASQGVHAPRLLRWAKTQFVGPDIQKSTMVYLVANVLSLKPEVARAILSGEVQMAVDGDDVVIEWPGDNPMEESPNVN